MKTLYIIGGTMGVGKTTVCHILKDKLNNSIFLDGDWCWEASPSQVTDETKALVEDNICYVLNNYLKCSTYDNIIFCWVMHKQEIIDSIVSRLNLNNCKVVNISLICSENTLINQLQKDIDNGMREQDVIDRSINRLSFYKDLDSIKIDITDKTPEEVADFIIEI